MNKRMSTLVAGGALLFAGAAHAEVIDDFESGSFSTTADWTEMSGGNVVVDFDNGGATGGDAYAHITGFVGGTFFNGDWDNDFDLTFDVRVQETGEDRALNVHTSSSGNTNRPSMNLRYQDGEFALFDGDWNPASDLGQLVAGEWHRMRIEGRSWGTENAHYNLHLSEAGSTELTRSATGLTYAQYDNAPIDTARAHRFAFTAEFGNNPGFDIDNVVATVPEPGSLALLGAGGLLLLSRRRARHA